MKRLFLSLILLGIAVAPAQPLAQAKPAAAGRVVEIEGNDQMKFTVTNLTAKPGEPLVVRLKVVGAMPKMAMAHNFVLLKAGIDAAKFANESALAGPAANYIAPARKADVVASTPLAGAGETVEVTFKAPAQAGTYTFICSFPGHFAAGMRGTLVVK